MLHAPINPLCSIFQFLPTGGRAVLPPHLHLPPDADVPAQRDDLLRVRPLRLRLPEARPRQDGALHHRLPGHDIAVQRGQVGGERGKSGINLRLDFRLASTTAVKKVFCNQQGGGRA